MLMLLSTDALSGVGLLVDMPSSVTQSQRAQLTNYTDLFRRQPRQKPRQTHSPAAAAAAQDTAQMAHFSSRTDLLSFCTFSHSAEAIIFRT